MEGAKKTTVNQCEREGVDGATACLHIKTPKVNSPPAFVLLLRLLHSSRRVREVEGGKIILHLPQYVCSLIKSEQLCALGDAFSFFFQSALTFS